MSDFGFIAQLQWIGSKYGGREHEPAKGLRPSVRFQRYVRDYCEGAVDVQLVSLDFDPRDRTSIVECRFSSRVTPKREWLQKDELIELLDGYRVIAVGKITEIVPGEP